MSSIPKIKVDGLQVPAFMYGTAWKEDETTRCVLDAINAGFRAIDTANQRKHYNEQGVGKALQRAYDSNLVQRSDLFLQTKYTYIAGQDSRLPYDPQADFATQVAQSFAKSQEHLGTDVIDSYVLHGPSRRAGLSDDDWQVWGAMEAIKNAGHVRVLGVSNVGLDQIKQLVQHAEIKPSFVQNRCYAQTGWDKNVRSYCREQDIVYQGFSLLTANQPIFSDPWFHELLQTRKMTAAQAVFRFATQVGMLPLTGTTDPAHMLEDLQCFQADLSPDEISKMETILL